MIRVLLVDDHAVVRMGFRLLLQSSAEITVVGEADSGESACQMFLELVFSTSPPPQGAILSLTHWRAWLNPSFTLL